MLNMYLFINHIIVKIELRMLSIIIIIVIIIII